MKEVMIISDTIDRLQKELHYSRSKMVNVFPDLFKQLERERTENHINSVNEEFRKMKKEVELIVKGKNCLNCTFSCTNAGQQRDFPICGCYTDVPVKIKPWKDYCRK